MEDQLARDRQIGLEQKLFTGSSFAVRFSDASKSEPTSDLIEPNSNVAFFMTS